MVTARHGGRLPPSLAALQALPGVGRSTAGAILAIAFDLPAPILDGNVRRVLCRLLALHGDPRAAAAEKRLWAWAGALTSRARPHDYAQAIMDLGATLCTPRRPACPACPWQELCQGYRLGVAERLPEVRARKPVPRKRQVALLLERDGAVLVCRRGLEGMLGGLWEFPSRDLAESADAGEVAGQLAAELGGGPPRGLGSLQHLYSHFRLEVQLFSSRGAGVARVAEASACRWIPVAELPRLALHGAHQKALQLIPQPKEP